MGKVKGIFASNISGRVGNVVFRKNGTENIVAQRPASVKNPRSYEQMRQRAYIKTVAAAYSLLKPICDHSFEGVSYGAKSMAHFNKVNFPLVKSFNSIIIKDASNFIAANKMLVSDGSLIAPQMEAVTGGMVSFVGFKSGVVGELKDLATVKVSTLLAFLGCEIGDQITVLNVVKGEPIYKYDNVFQPSESLYYSRYIFKNPDATAFTQKQNAGGETFWIVDSANLDANSEVNDNALLVADLLKMIISNSAKLSKSANAACIISRKVGTTWQRSKSYLISSDENLASNFDTVINSYMPNPEMYLNNATV